MPRLYRAAPGCKFPESVKKKDIDRHLQRKTWCPCKKVGWTAEQALDPGSVTRRTATCGQQNKQVTTTNITGDHNTVNNIVVNVPPAVFPSGSSEERAYLKRHAQAILEAITAGTERAEPDMVNRFVQNTWCSAEHEQLNNVVAANSRSNEFVILRMRGDRPTVEQIAGRGAPSKLLDIAERVLHQFAVDAGDGYDPSRYGVPFYEATYDTAAEAEDERARWGRGVVCKMYVAGTGRHDGDCGSYWINNRAAFVNVPPAEPSQTTDLAGRVAGVGSALRRPAARKDAEQTVACQLRAVPDKGSKRARLEDGP